MKKSKHKLLKEIKRAERHKCWLRRNLPNSNVERKNQKILIKLDQGSKTISVECTLRIDTINELQYYKSDGILNFVLRNILKN